MTNRKSKKFGEAIDTYNQIKEQMKEMLDDGKITQEWFDKQMKQIAEDLGL